ncbi:MAG: D-glycero-beta-D-manno-heptose 1-phosphate adenylyltransferase [Candidatus Aenigmatarchaeota archaeon]
MDKIKSLNEIVDIVNKLRKDGKKIVTTNGCFDILHIGHIRYLREAKKLGDVLIVGVNSDKSIKKIKGGNRPIIPENERMEILAALECVDFVFLFDDLNPIKWINKLKPDIHVKGGDYTIDKIIERNAVESYGGKIMLVGKVEGISTTDIIKKIRGK